MRGVPMLAQELSMSVALAVCQPDLGPTAQNIEAALRVGLRSLVDQGALVLPEQMPEWITGPSLDEIRAEIERSP